jgi:hypothetical protein
MYKVILKIWPAKVYKLSAALVHPLPIQCAHRT